MSPYERLLALWTALGGQRADRTGPAWTWRRNPTPDEITALLTHAPVGESMASIKVTLQCFLSAAHHNLTEITDRDIHDPRIDQARELIREVLAETLVDNIINELDIPLETP